MVRLMMAVALLALTATTRGDEKAEPSPKPGYAEQHARALKEGRALIVWVGMPAQPFFHPEALHCEDGSLFPEVKRGIIIARPQNGVLVWLATLPLTVPPDALWHVLNEGLSA
jgi:hypothetical protein